MSCKSEVHPWLSKEYVNKFSVSKLGNWIIGVYIEHCVGHTSWEIYLVSVDIGKFRLIRNSLNNFGTCRYM